MSIAQFFFKGKMRSWYRITALKANTWKTGVCKSQLACGGAVPGPNEWFMQSQSVIVISPIALWALKLGIGWVPQWTVLLALDITQTQRTGACRWQTSLPTPRAVSQQDGTKSILSPFFLTYLWNRIRFILLLSHVCGRPQGREIFREKWLPTKITLGGNKRKIKAAFEAPASTCFPTCQLLFQRIPFRSWSIRIFCRLRVHFK